MKLNNPYTKLDYEVFQKLYEENLKNDPVEMYLRIMKIVFGKKS